jgi:uncharacterized protein YxeA
MKKVLALIVCILFTFSVTAVFAADKAMDTKAPVMEEKKADDKKMAADKKADDKKMAAEKKADEKK